MPALSDKNLTLKASFTKDGESISISGDDILIEYCERLVLALQKVTETQLNPSHLTNILKFINHYVWKAPKLDSLTKP